MGRKVQPYGFRVGVTRDWESKWFAEAKYADNVHEDIKLRNVILNALPDAGVSQILIDRNATQIKRKAPHLGTNSTSQTQRPRTSK